MTTANIVQLLPELERRGLNVKLVAALSPQLFAAQEQEYRDSIVSEADRFDSTYITNRSRRLMRDWTYNPLADAYAMSSDFDDRWRTGGRLDEVIEEAHLDCDHLMEGIERFVTEREKRLARLDHGVRAARDAG
jgi:transketolase